MTQVSFSLKIERIPGDSKFVRLLEDFQFFSDVLEGWCIIPKGFVYDEESVPIIKGTNPEGGAVHDYFCRIDSKPVVTKKEAALVYFEIQDYFDDLEAKDYPDTFWGRFREKANYLWDLIRRKVKTGVVMIAPGYFHKFTVMATYEEQKGK